MRKIIQIVVTQETKREKGALFALCDDGSLWARILFQDNRWYRINSIPQDKEES